jgi:hypothetical protein
MKKLATDVYGVASKPVLASKHFVRLSWRSFSRDLQHIVPSVEKTSKLMRAERGGINRTGLKKMENTGLAGCSS